MLVAIPGAPLDRKKHSRRTLDGIGPASAAARKRASSSSSVTGLGSASHISVGVITLSLVGVSGRVGGYPRLWSDPLWRQPQQTLLQGESRGGRAWPCIVSRPQ